MNTAPNRRARANRSAPANQAAAANRTMLVPRDLPVLFQMPDVSRESVTAKHDLHIESPVAPAAEPIAAAPAPPPTIAPEVSFILPPTKAPEPAAEALTKQPDTTVEPKTESRPASKSMPALRPERKAAPIKEGTWFDGQGKLITVCFLIALIATIYFARAGREPESPARQVAWPETHPGDAAGKGGAPPPAPTPAHSEPPKLTDAPKTDLLPPIENFPAPTLANEPSSPTPPALTPEVPVPPTANPEEPRTAALPPAPAPSAPPPAAPPPEYPGYPSTNPSNYPPQNFGPPMPPAVPSPSNQGAGYERTGSGLY